MERYSNMHMARYGKIFPKLYDTLMGDYSHLVNPLAELLKKYSPRPQKVLELGCGTGNILTLFPKAKKVYGLDISKEMLAIAKNKIPHAIFVEGNMTNFHIAETFDLILCMFDAINHLDSANDWEQTFKHVAQHLEAKGVFIFDSNSLERFEILKALPIFTRAVGPHVASLDYKKTKNKLEFHFSFFMKLFGNFYTLHERTIPEISFPLPTIKAMLRKNFVIKKVISVKQEKRFPQSVRYFFVCVKK